jgi:hypothetical protein
MPDGRYNPENVSLQKPVNLCAGNPEGEVFALALCNHTLWEGHKLPENVVVQKPAHSGAPSILKPRCL